MVVLGVGVGLCMPVPTVVVQSTVDYAISVSPRPG